MSSVVISGDTSGSVTLAAPAVAGTTTLTLPTTSATLITDSSGVLNIGSGQVYKDASGNVGIGTTSPISGANVSLTANGSIAVSGALSVDQTSRGIFDYNPSVNAARFLSYGAIGTVGSYIWYAGSGGAVPSERMRIDSSGNVLVGTTTVRGKFNNVAASSQGSGYNAFFQNTWSGDVSTAALYVAKFDNNSTTSQQFVRFSINNDATGSGQINANGASAAAFGSFSDKRLKENIVDLPSQLNNIMALRPVEFDYIESEGSGHQIGFIAQEVKEIYPDLVGEREDGMFTLTDMNKNDARLIKAIQEQQALIQSQAAAINDLKARIETLEAK
jgi:hypothetical protein